jgi:hypothetical protein
MRGHRGRRAADGVYVLLCAYALGLPLRRQFGPDERAAFLTATTFVSIVASAAGVMIGEFWSWLVEMIRVDDSHLSYRALRLP